MKRTLFFISLIFLTGLVRAQYVYTINADSVKITNHCDTAELILENHTQNIAGFLFNKGRGRTEFRKALLKTDDSTYVLGADTLHMPRAITASNGLSMNAADVRLGQTVGQSGDPAALTANREIPLNGFTLAIRGFVDASSSNVFFRPYSDDYMQSVLNSNTFTRFRIDNSNPGNSAGAGTLCSNNAPHFGYYYMASTNNAYIPDGFAVVSNGGSGGLAFVAQPGPITFCGGVGAPYVNSEYARFTNSGRLGLGQK
ncbi:MAG: hypothetical protein JST39_13820, partial [Bacteroidetes bacterium]|nr:hypothetical protein [Bacteroidota bacterium]